MSGVFDLERIAASGLVGGIDFHNSIGSTNDRSLDLGVRDGLQLPVLVLTEQQTAGRGRGANRWMAGAGALTFSLLLHAPSDRLPVRRWPQVALAAGVAVCDALRMFVRGTEVRVKWPNDVFLSGRKICGILSESVPGARERLVVGIGVNVNNRVQGPGVGGQESELRGQRSVGSRGQDSVLSTHYEVLSAEYSVLSTATSLIDHDGLERDLTAILLAVLDEFDRRWRELLGDRFDLIAADYRKRCFLTGKSVRIEQLGGKIVAGACGGIDEEGRLVVATEWGEEKVVSGTVAQWG